MRVGKKKKRLQIKTVIRRAQRFLRSGSREWAILAVRVYTDYSPTEAEKFVHYIEQFTEPVSLIAHNWCDEHRACRFQCATQHPEESQAQQPTAAGAISAAMSPAGKCLCGTLGCRNEWHALARWIKDNPFGWERVLAELRNPILDTPDTSGKDEGMQDSEG